MKTLQEIRFVSTHFFNLQGLRIVPIGLYLVLICYWASGLKYPLNANSSLIPVLGLIGAVILYIGVDRYYLHAFGQIKRSPASLRLETLFMCLSGILMLAAVWIDITFKMPLSLVGLAAAASFLADYIRITWLVKGRYLLYHPLGIILLVIVSVLPLLGFSNWWLSMGLKSQFVGIAAVLGIYTIISGIWGHLFLLSAFPSKVNFNDHTI